MENSPFKRIEIDEIDFQVGCRRFTIRATVTRDRQLPVVDEFTLRLLAILHRVPIARLRGWFGFSAAEMETVLVDLEQRAIVEVDGDDVQLAPAGVELFRGIPDDGVPRVVEVAPITENVWFDLVSRNMVRRSRTRPVDYIIPIREQQDARLIPESYARKAFEQNFRDYARRIRRFPDADSVSIYSISEVEPGPYGYQTVRAIVEFEPGKRSIRTNFAELGEDVAHSFRMLTTQATDEWRALSAPEATPTAAAEYERITGDPLLGRLIADPGNDAAWTEALARTPTADFVPLVGAPYLSHNLEKLGDAFASRAETCALDGEIVWLRPAGSGWGRTFRIPSALQAVRDALRNASVSEQRTTLLMPRSTPRGQRKLHQRVFDTAFFLPSGYLPANLEVLLIGGSCAFVGVHVALDSASVTIGGIVTNQRRVDKLIKRLGHSTNVSWEEIWKRDPGQTITAQTEDTSKAE